MIKVYGIHGKTTALLRIPARSGKAWIEVEFKRGKLGLGASNQAATFSTADATQQAIIEDSPMFGNKIKLLRVYRGNSEQVAPALETAKPAGAEITKVNVPEVETREQAIAYLKSKGAKATQLRDDDAIARFADKIGVSFPNLNL